MEDRRPLVVRGAMIGVIVTFPILLALCFAGKWLVDQLFSIL